MCMSLILQSVAGIIGYIGRLFVFEWYVLPSSLLGV